MQPVNYQKYNPVITISLKGKILVAIVRFYYRIRQFLGKDKWHSLIPDHHEDPLTMTVAEKLYLGHKYYFKAMIQPEEGSGLDRYFSNQDLLFMIPEGFTPFERI